jgi:hypothetical protein
MTWWMLVGFLAFIPALFGLAWAFDSLRGHPRADAFKQDVQAMQRRLGAPDAPAWAEAVGMVLGLGLTHRSACHLLAAVIAGADLELADNDVSAASPVLALRKDWRGAMAGRVLAVGVGGAAWLTLAPLSMQFPGPAWATVLGRGYVVAQLGVLLADPLFQLKPMFNSDTSEVTYSGEN